MKIIKTNLVQALEITQEMNEMTAIVEGYKKEIINNMAVPFSMLGGDSESSSTMYPNKPALIKIDVTKLI